MRYGVLAVVLIGAATLGGCSEGVLDPKGPIAVAERQILFNSLGIMLAIVIPTIFATLGVAFWFRVVEHARRYLPDFNYSGRLELLVWSIPAMTCSWSAASPGSARTISIRVSRSPLRPSQSGFRLFRSTGNGCSSIPTRASPASIN